VDAAVLGDELEVGPGAEGLVVGKPLADEGEGLTFVGVFGGCDLLPELGRLVHGGLAGMGVLYQSRVRRGLYG
jgi:hypothetical protein